MRQYTEYGDEPHSVADEVNAWFENGINLERLSTA